jgi:hypothetical protein
LGGIPPPPGAGGETTVPPSSAGISGAEPQHHPVEVELELESELTPELEALLHATWFPGSSALPLHADDARSAAPAAVVAMRRSRVGGFGDDWR